MADGTDIIDEIEMPIVSRIAFVLSVFQAVIVGGVVLWRRLASDVSWF